MEDHRAVVCRVEVFPHANADRLELAMPVGTDWVAVVGKGQFKTGDLAIYVPIDSIVPHSFIQTYLSNSKIKIKNNQIRSVKIRGVISQGLLVLPDPEHRLGQDVTDELGIKKHEPPTPLWNTNERRVSQKQKGFWGYINAMFPKYTKIKNYKNYNNVIPQSTPVVITEKIHGTNFRAGWVDVSKYKHPWYKRLWSRMTKKLPESVFVIGSHNMIRRKTDPIYHRAAREAGLDKLGEEWSGFVFFGEVYGLGIQELSYGVTPGEIDLVIFDIYYANKYRQVSYLPWGEVQSICVYLGLNTPPVLYEGPWDRSLAKIHADGPSMIPGAKHHREGVVIRPVTETWSPDVGRWILKRISDTYLLGKDRTENH